MTHCCFHCFYLPVFNVAISVLCICCLNDNLHNPRTYCWSSIIFSKGWLSALEDSYKCFRGVIWNGVQVSLTAVWLAVRPLGLIGDAKQCWASDISLGNNLTRQIYFPGTHYDREQSAPIIPETTHSITQCFFIRLSHLQCNSPWLKKVLGLTFQCSAWNHLGVGAAGTQFPKRPILYRKQHNFSHL